MVYVNHISNAILLREILQAYRRRADVQCCGSYEGRILARATELGLFQVSLRVSYSEAQ